MLVGCFLRKHFVQEGDALPVSVVHRCQRECSRRVNALAHAKPTMDVTNFPESPLMSSWMPSISDPFAWSSLRPIKMARKVNIKPMPVMKAGSYP